MARVMYIVNNPAFFVSHRLPLARAALARGHEVVVAAPAGEGSMALEQAGIRTVHFALDRGSRRLASEAKSLVSLGVVMRQWAPTLVHAVTIKPVIYGGILARALSVPCYVAAVSGLGWVFLDQGPLAAARRRVVEGAYRTVFSHPNARVIVQNTSDQATLVNAGCVPLGRTALVAGSGVDASRFVPRPPPPGAPIVMMASRLLLDKGVREFLLAAQQLRGKARFVLVGDFDQANPACLPANELNAAVAAGDVEFFGHRTEMEKILPMASIFALPSYREGLPKVVLEAQACGVAVVTTDVPGCRDAIVPEKTGKLVPARDANALANGIRSLLDDPVCRTELGLAAREHVIAHHSDAAIAEQTMQLYDTLLEQAEASRCR